MRIWVDVYQNGERIGAGGVPCKFISIKQNLDGAGAYSVTFAGGDDRLPDLIRVGRELRLWRHDGVASMMLGGGRIVRVRVRDSEAGREWSVNGVSLLDDLGRASVLLGLKYENEALADVVEDLVGDGWTIYDDTDGNVTARFDGVSRLRALVKLAEMTGYHFREEAGRVLRFGTLGTLAPVRLYGGGSSAAFGQSFSSNEVVPVARIVVDEQIEDVVNWVLPLGSGDGDVALTLAQSTRNSPYPIEEVSLPDGRTGYYVRDTDSIAEWGKVARVVKFQNIAPLANDDENIERASNALYDACVAYLQRAKEKRVSYSVAVLASPVMLKPGDRVRLTYKGMAETREGYAVDIDVNEDLWVIRSDVSSGLEGTSYQLELSTVDAVQRDGIETVVGALEEVEISRTAIQSYPVGGNYVYVRQMDSTRPANVPIPLSDAVLSLVRATVRIQTRPFRTNVTGAAAGGDHRHRMFLYTGAVSPSPAGSQFAYRVSAGPPFSSSIDILAVLGITADLWTEGASGNHTHPMQYGIFDDSVTPNTIRIALNGVDLTASLGGAWAVGGGATVFNVDITDALKNAVGGLRQTHTLRVSCDSGRGEIEAVVELIKVEQTLVVL